MGWKLPPAQQSTISSSILSTTYKYLGLQSVYLRHSLHLPYLRLGAWLLLAFYDAQQDIVGNLRALIENLKNRFGGRRVGSKRLERGIFLLAPSKPVKRKNRNFHVTGHIFSVTTTLLVLVLEPNF